MNLRQCPKQRVWEDSLYVTIEIILLPKLIEVIAVKDPLPIITCSSLGQLLSSRVVMVLQMLFPITIFVHCLLTSFNLEQ